MLMDEAGWQYTKCDRPGRGRQMLLTALSVTSQDVTSQDVARRMLLTARSLSHREAKVDLRK